MTSNSGNSLRVELHVHTCYSRDSLLSMDALLNACRQRGIDRVAITDHNQIEGALLARQSDPDRVIVGEEIQTLDGGELLGYFLHEWVPPRLPYTETIQRLRDQGAVISIPHPFDDTRQPGWSEEALYSIAPAVDAVEVFNARCFSRHPNDQAKKFARSLGLLETVGSDAHSIYELGRTTLSMADFKDASEFKNALRTAAQETKLSPPWTHLLSRYAVLRKAVTRR